jgi:hypothetical protein
MSSWRFVVWSCKRIRCLNTEKFFEAAIDAVKLFYKKVQRDGRQVLYRFPPMSERIFLITWSPGDQLSSQFSQKP